MSLMYSATFSEVSVSADQDIFSIVAPTNNSVILHSFFFGQSSDAGDAEAELLPWSIRRGATTAGSGGSSVTAGQVFSGAAFGGTVRRNDTTPASAGTIVTLHADTFNVALGIQYRPTPEERIHIAGGERLVLGFALTVDPADAITCSGTVYFEVV